MITLALAARYLVALGTLLMLLAVAANFLLARRSGPVARVRRSPVATLTMLAFFLLLYVLLRLRITSHPATRVELWAGILLVASGTGLGLWGRWSLGTNWGDQATLYRDQTLVATGAFRVVRHPLYASLVWMGAGAALVFGNPLALGAVLGIFVPMMVYRARLEEALLRERFPEYADYRRRTGMLFPTPWSN